jgi:DNA replication protein DnaC
MNLPEDSWRVKIQEVPESVRATIESYLKRFDDMALKGAGLVLWGDPGVGKTGIAALVAKEARQRGYVVYFTTVYELRELTRSYIKFEEGQSILDRCREVDVLVLDGFEESDITEKDVNLRSVEDLLLYRGSKLKVSILTTGLARDHSKADNFYDAVATCAVPLKVEGADLRQRRSEDLLKIVGLPLPVKKG